jgi:hypothetical protein
MGAGLLQQPISGLLNSFGKNSRDALISKEPTNIVEKFSVNSRCSSIDKKLGSRPLVLVKEPKKIRNINSERFARNPALLARPQTFVLHQILRHVSSFEIRDIYKWITVSPTLIPPSNI